VLRSVAEVGADLKWSGRVDETLDVARRDRWVVLDPVLEVIRILEEMEERVSGLIGRGHELTGGDALQPSVASQHPLELFLPPRKNRHLSPSVKGVTHMIAFRGNGHQH
jgi:hypothetical protein